MTYAKLTRMNAGINYSYGIAAIYRKEVPLFPVNAQCQGAQLLENVLKSEKKRRT